MPLRRAAVASLSLALGASTLLGGLPSSAAAPADVTSTVPTSVVAYAGFAVRRGTDAPWSGYSIRTTGTAAGGWIGGRKYAGRPVYRIDPAARPHSRGFRELRVEDRLAGPGARSDAGPRATARAAWILSKYGDYRYAVQNAAVDAAVLQLLARGDWKLGRAAGQRRLEQSGKRRAIAKFARIMLRDSKTYAGPYRLGLTSPTEVVPGVGVSVSVGVTSARTGAPIRSLPVSVVVDGVTVPGGVTDDSGNATVALPAPTLGSHPFTVRVAKTPESHLLVRKPRSARASRIVVAGRKRTLEATGSFAVRATPAVRVPDRVVPVSSGSSVTSSFVLSDADGAVARPAAVALYGPFESDQPACTGTPVATGSVQVTGNGTYQLPTVRIALPTRSLRYYFWSVSVPATDTNQAAATCSGRIGVVRLSRHSDARSVRPPRSSAPD